MIQTTDIKIPNVEIGFDEATHTYRLDGYIIPSVTTIMRPLSNDHYKGINDATLSAAADRGTTVHEAIEEYIKYDFDDCPEELMPYFLAFKKWYEAVKPVPIASEFKIYHKILRYAGTADMICLIDGKTTLVDFKTTSTLSESMCGVQLEAYAQALSTHGVKIQEKRILQIKKDGKFVEKIFPERDLERWKVFNALKTVYDYQQKK